MFCVRDRLYKLAVRFFYAIANWRKDPKHGIVKDKKEKVMIVRAIKTRRITPKSTTLQALLDEVITDMQPGSVLAISSKIVSLCEGNVVPIDAVDKLDLMRAEADWYADYPFDEYKYAVHFSIKNNILIPMAGIDESNAGDVHVLWPADPQASANAMRAYLQARFGHDAIGVVITDSTCRPMRRGVSGIALSFSGFKPLKDYVGQPDLFARPFKVSQADVVGGLAATAVLAMGEGAESTPLVLLEDLPFVEFVPHDPSEEELASVRIALEDDLFAPFLQKVTWLPGGGGRSKGK